MIPLLDELNQQPLALCHLIETLRHSEMDLLACLEPVPALPLLTGMGASYHAAWIASIHLQSLGCPAVALEAMDLVTYAVPLLRQQGNLLYVSQSGESGEVVEVIKLAPPGLRLVALTNFPDSRLGKAAQTVFPLMAGDETLISSKTYLNSLAWLWLIARAWAGVLAGDELQKLEVVASKVDALLSQRQALTSILMDTFAVDQGIVFVGHGPAAATARQAAMMLSEWAKVPARSAGIAAFRHGFIETVRPGLGMVVIAPPGRSQASALNLAEELSGYGARVLLLQNGSLFSMAEFKPGSDPVDEFLSPLLDIVPVQLYANALVEASGMTPGFRYISKVVRKI